MRISILCAYFQEQADIAKGHIGGVERYVTSLTCEFLKQGHKVDVLTSTSERGGRLFSDRLTIHRFRRFLAVHRNPFFPYFLHNPSESDIIHVQASYPGMSDLATIWAKAHRKPSILTYHFDPPVVPALTSLYQHTLAHLLKRYPKIIITTRNYIHTSPFLKSIQKKKLVIIPNGVNINFFKPTRSIDDHKITIPEEYYLFVGRFVPYKGIGVLLKSLKKTNKKAILVGNGPLITRIQYLIKRYNLSIQIMTELPNKILPFLYTNAEATILPSINSQEAFGIVLLESMACGTPVIASDLPGVGEVARMGGSVFPVGDHKSLSAILMDHKKQEYDLNSIRKHVAENYSWEIIAERFLGEYKQVLEG